VGAIRRADPARHKEGIPMTTQSGTGGNSQILIWVGVAIVVLAVVYFMM